MKYDFIIVGSGLFGATFAYMAHKKGYNCLVIDKRSHAGGNIYCENIEGINVHKYGAHIFHTSDSEIWKFVNHIVPFNRFINSPIAQAPNGKCYNLPFNMNTFNQLWGVKTPKEALDIIERQRKDILDHLIKKGIAEPRNLEEQALSLVGKDIYELLIKGYTEKQWGRPCNQLPSFIIKRIPVRLTYDNNYFNDSFQGIPIGGYNKLIDSLLKNSDLILNEDFFDNKDFWINKGDKIIYTGKIDEFYQYKFGRLEYRTVKFETEIINTSNYQGNAVFNFTDINIPYTRIIEHKHFEDFGNSVYEKPLSVISKEFSTEWEEGKEPFYPINDSKNQDKYIKYKKLAEKEKNIIFGGRLAEYKYYDMAPIIRKVLDIFKKNII